MSRERSPEHREKLRQAAYRRWGRTGPKKNGHEPPLEMPLAPMSEAASESNPEATVATGTATNMVDAVLSTVTTGRLLRELNDRKASEGLIFTLQGGRVLAYQRVPQFIQEE